MSATGSPTEVPTGPFHFDFDAIDWLDERAAGKAPIAMIEQAERLGAKRKRLAAGECGFYMNYSVLPPGYRIDTHSHGHAELIMVIEGGATVDARGEEADIVLDKGDSIVLDGGFEYGITCGANGMEFVTIRTGDATTTPV